MYKTPRSSRPEETVKDPQVGLLVVVVDEDGKAIESERFTKGDWAALAWESVALKRIEHPDREIKVKPIRRKLE